MFEISANSKKDNKTTKKIWRPYTDLKIPSGSKGA